MLQWLNRTPNFDFVKYRRVAMATSVVLSLIAFVSLFYPGLNYGLDFTGGVIVEADYSQPAELDAIRDGSGRRGLRVRRRCRTSALAPRC